MQADLKGLKPRVITPLNIAAGNSCSSEYTSQNAPTSVVKRTLSSSPPPLSYFTSLEHSIQTKSSKTLSVDTFVDAEPVQLNYLTDLAFGIPQLSSERFDLSASPQQNDSAYPSQHTIIASKKISLNAFKQEEDCNNTCSNTEEVDNVVEIDFQHDNCYKDPTLNLNIMEEINDNGLEADVKPFKLIKVIGIDKLIEKPGSEETLLKNDSVALNSVNAFKPHKSSNYNVNAEFPQIVYSTTSKSNKEFKQDEKTYAEEHNKLNNQKDNVTASKKKFTCCKCDLTFNSNSQANRHYRMHLNGMPYHCEKCGEPFTSKKVLQSHMITHNKKRHQCKQCMLLFHCANYLRKHTLTVHLNDNTYKCEFCDKVFTRKTCALTHLRYHTNERIYKCEQCDNSFVTKPDLNRHRNKLHSPSSETTELS